MVQALGPADAMPSIHRVCNFETIAESNGHVVCFYLCFYVSNSIGENYVTVRSYEDMTLLNDYICGKGKHSVVESKNTAKIRSNCFRID